MSALVIAWCVLFAVGLVLMVVYSLVGRGQDAIELAVSTVMVIEVLLTSIILVGLIVSMKGV